MRNRIFSEIKTSSVQTFYDFLEGEFEISLRTLLADLLSGSSTESDSTRSNTKV